MKTVRRLRGLLVFLLMSLLLVVYLLVQNNWIQPENIRLVYDNLPSAFDGFRIVHISDTHLPKNASSVEKIVRLVAEQEPDIVVMTGDSIDMSAELNSCRLEELCEGLSAICGVYAVTGNHEVASGQILEWKSILSERGAMLLDDDYIFLEREGQKIVIAGLRDGELYSADTFASQELPDYFQILIAHRPELWVSYLPPDGPRPDLVLAGHAHGGQIRIPGVGGLVAPDQGFFPQYTSGVYALDDATNMVVSRGLGNSILPFRVNNRPHLPVITLVAG